MSNKKDVQVAVRLDEKTRRQLQKEAEEAKRKLSDYIRVLLETHPDRVKKPN